MARTGNSGDFEVVVWCPDCNGVDFEGCFGGGADTLGPFSSREAAEAAGQSAVGDSIWLFEIKAAHAALQAAGETP